MKKIFFILKFLIIEIILTFVVVGGLVLIGLIVEWACMSTINTIIFVISVFIIVYFIFIK